MICVTHFCTLRESKKLRPMSAIREYGVDSRMAVGFLTRATCKIVRQNLIPRATAYNCWTAAGTYVRAGLCLYAFGLRMCADSTILSYLAVSGWLAGGMLGNGDLHSCFYDTPWQLLGWRPGWKYCSGFCGWLLLDLLSISRMLCSVAVSGVMLPTRPDCA